MTKLTLYDAFTKVSSVDKKRITSFLQEHLEDMQTKAQDIQQALDYAVKDIPSFGGFIVSVEKDGEIVGTSVVSNTGMGGFSAKHLMVYLAVHKAHRSNGVLGKLMDKTLERTSGDLALHLTPKHPNFERLQSEYGFQARYVEMTLS